MLELKNISRIYTQKKGPEVKALDNVSLTFGRKGMVFVLGKSGSGKSTLLNVIGGLDKYTAGELVIKGKSTAKFTQSEFDSYRNTMIGFIFQEYNVLDDFTVGQNIGIAIELQGKKASEVTINKILDDVGLNGLGHRKPNTLSGGQKQRVAIARALVKSPDIIMADEPTGALDSTTGKQILETLKYLSNEKLVIVVSHDREFAETYGDRIIEFKDGQVISDITKTKVEGHVNNISFSEEGISVSAKYTLTDEDVAKINEYLKNPRDKSLIRVLNSEYTYAETDQNAQEVSSEPLKLIKAKLPFKSALKMGASALNHKKGRLVMSIILSSMAFTMFGVTDAIAAFNTKDATVNSLIDSQIEYGTFTKYQQKDLDEDMYFSQDLRLNDEDIVELNKLDNRLNFFPILNEVRSYAYNLKEIPETGIEPYYGVDAGGIVHFSNEQFSDAGFSLVHGNLPASGVGHEKEIAVTQYALEVFMKYGYKNLTTGIKYDIHSAADLIGKKLNNSKVGGELEIVGVVKTNFDGSRFEKLRHSSQLEPLEQMLLLTQFNSYLNDSPHNVVFVNDTYFENQATAVVSYLRPVATYIEFSNDENWLFGDNFSLLQNDPKTIFTFNDSIDPENLKDDEIILGANSASLLYRLFYNDLNLIDAAILARLVGKEAIIEAYLTEAYPALEVGNHALWSEAERSEYYELYLYALYDTSEVGLYQSNPYDVNGDGKSLIFEEATTIIRANYTVDTIRMNVSAYYEVGGFQHDVKVVGFVIDRSDLYDQNIYISDAFALKHNFIKDGKYSKAMSFLDLNDHNLVNKVVDYHFAEKGEGIFYRMANEVVLMMGLIGEILIILTSIFIWVGVVFALFAALLLINFITLSVAFKKRQIGILRAIGARGQDVATIFLMEATIIAFINFTLASILTGVVTTYVNDLIRNQVGLVISILNLSLRQVGLILVIALFIAYLSSTIPVLRISRKRPIDAIRVS